VLLLHGVPETSSVWRDVAPKLATGRRVLAPDLPGLGGSSYAGPYDVPSLVAQLAALIESEARGAVDVVGHDWGGSIALGLAGQRPDLVRRLCVANAPFRHVPLHRAVHIPLFALPVLPELIFRLGGRRVVDTMLALAWKSSTPLDEERRSEYEAAYSDPEKVAAMLAYYRATARPRVKALLTRSAPVGTPQVKVEKSLVLWGALDPVLPIGTGETVVRDLGADCVMVTVPGAGHFVIEEATAVVTDVLLDFLRDDAAPSAKTAAATKAPVKKAPVKKAPAAKAAPTKAPAAKAAPKKAAAKKAQPKTTSSAPEAPPSPGSR
jgi:pimeloyl-ACP methyl ester carboxylesterase